MALTNPEGNYLKITNINYDDKRLFFNIFKDQNVRERGADIQFEQVRNKSKYLPDLFDVEFSKACDADKSIKDNALTAAYSALKQAEKFSEWSDA